MSQEWYYAKGEQKHGPVTSAQLRDLADSGELNPTDHVWSEGMSNWRPAGAVKGLFVSPQSGPPPLPSKSEVSEPSTWSVSLTNQWVAASAGKKTILASSFGALGSLFLKWIDIGFASGNGFSQGAYFQLLFLLYPALMPWWNKPVNRVFGLLCVFVAAITTVDYIASLQGEIFGRQINTAGGGPFVFLMSCIGLAVGVWIYRPDHVRVQAG